MKGSIYMDKRYYIIEEPYIWDIWAKPYYGLQFPTSVYADSKPVIKVYSNLKTTIKAVRKLMQYSTQYIYIVEESEDGHKDITKDVIHDIEDDDAMANFCQQLFDLPKKLSEGIVDYNKIHTDFESCVDSKGNILYDAFINPRPVTKTQAE